MPAIRHRSIVNHQSSIVNSPLAPYLTITAVYVLSMLIVDPRGEFPLNDDWSYTRSAFRSGQEGRMQVDEWCAMTLVGQALYGGLLTKLFCQSFLLLRLSTLALSCGVAFLLWHILRQTGVRRGTAWVAVLGWIFNPIQFSLSHTYMTEVPFLFFATLGLAFYLAYIQNNNSWLLVGCAVALGYAFLIRQTSVLFVAPVVVAILARKNLGWPEKLRGAALFCFTSLLFAGTYYFWLSGHGGATPATRRKFELLSHIGAEQVVGNLFGLLFYTVFMLLPLLIWLLPALRRVWKESAAPIRVFSLIFWIVFSGFGLSWFYLRYSHSEYLISKAFHARMPFLLNLLYDTGLGPLTLDPTYYGPPPTPLYPGLWIFVTLVVAVGLVVLGLLATLQSGRIWRRIREEPAGSIALIGSLSFLLMAAFEIIFSHLEEGGLFDRHILTAVLPLIPVLGILDRSGAQAVENPRLKKTAACGSYLSLVAFAYFSITATHDYLQWNRLRWDLGTRLLSQGVDPLTVSGGFEFNGWHNYDTFRARGGIGKVYHWWYDKRVYLITMEPHPGYEAVDRREYFSWLHRRLIPVYVLKQSSE